MATTTPEITPSELLSELKPVSVDQPGAHRYTGIKESTFEYWRHVGRGPAYIIVPESGQIRYYLSDLDEFLARGRVVPSQGPNDEQKRYRRRGGPCASPKKKLRHRAARRK